MPGKVGVKIKAGRNLPVMDRGSDTTDAYVEIKLGNVTHKTDVCRKSLNPQWNTDWFRFEVDDAELQDEPLQIRLMDHDTYSANDAIGKVYISLNPLCLETASQSNKGKGAVMSGWIPVFDTMHGIRGEVNIIVKVDLFSDANKFRQSSCGIQFFHSPNIPHGYKAQVIHGFVEELVVNDDPEYQWIDKIRTPRASNEARQVVFLKLSGQVQRKIGLKAINLGANAVIGYTQCFDLEGDVGVVARGIGTAVTLVKIQDSERAPSVDNALIEERTLKYLEFLKGGGSADEVYRSVFDSETTSGNSGNVVYKILGIEPLERVDTRSPNVILSRRWRPNANDTVIPEEQEEPEGMTKLLHQEDMRGEKPVKKFRHHMKRITRSSKSLLNEKLSVLKGKNDGKTGATGDGSGSLNSSFSDVSYTESIRSSLTDLRGFIKLKRNKKWDVSRSASDGSGMASLLINSVMRGPSLDCISEGRDSSMRSTPTPSLKSKFRNDIKSESMSNISQTMNKSPILSSNLRRQNSVQELENSASTVSSSSSSTTEEGFSDDEQSEVTTPNEIVVVDADTVSMVVQTVLAQESNDKDANNWIYPGSTQNDDNDDDSEKVFNKHERSEPSKKHQNSIEMEKISCNAEKKSCIPTGAVRISKKGKNFESEIYTKPRNIMELGCIIKEPSADEDVDNWIQPGSTTDEPETVDERSESILRELKENLAETFHHIQEHIHLPHFNDDKSKLKRQKALDDSSIDIGTFNKRSSIKLVETRRGSLDTISKKFHFSFGTKCAKNADDMPNKSKVKEILKSTQTNINKSKRDEHKSETVIQTSSISQSPTNNNNNRSRPIIVVNEDVSFYSSEPELMNIYDDNVSLSPDNLKVPPFTSLTNLNVSTSSLLYPSLPYNQTNSVSFKPKNFQCSITGIATSSHYTPLQYSFSSLRPSPQTDNNLIRNSQSFLNLDNNARNNFLLSSSDTNLSTTNKAQMLAPFPYLKQNRSELTASALASTIPITVASSISAAVAVTATSSLPVTAAVTSIPNTVSTTISAATTTTTAAVAAAAVLSPSNRMTITSTGHNRAESVGGCKLLQSPAKIGNSAPITTVGSIIQSTSNKEKDKDTGIYRRSSDSDLSVTPKGNSLCIASERLITATTLMRTSAKHPTQDNLDMLEYPFLTMSKYPQGFILHLGATVAARSVKLLERVPNPDEPETRDSWWTELRMEIRSHARALSCNVILGYSEITTISDDVCVLSATGTAAVINMSYNSNNSQFDLSSCLKRETMVSSLDERDCLKDAKNLIRNIDSNDQQNPIVTKELSSSFSGVTSMTAAKLTGGSFVFNYGCSMCHIPYSQSSVPFNVKMKKCSICKKGNVPDVLLTTIEIPECLQITGRGCFMQAQVVRSKKDLRSESNAKEISDGLPFLEYELHRLLINKLKAKGMNAIFGLKVQVAVGEKMMALIATGTAVYLTALPPPSVPKIVAGNSWTDMAKLKDLQRSLQDTVERNREIYQLKCFDPDLQNGKQSDTDESEDDVPELDLTTGNKDTCVLEVDDIEDLEIISSLMEPCPPEGFHVVNTQSVPGLQDLEVVRNLRMFTQVWRAKLCVGQNSGSLPKHFQRLLQTIFFKLRTMIPCAICDIRFRLDLPESDEIQVLVTGMALGLGEISKFSKLRRKTLSGGTSDNLSSSNQLTNGLGTGHKKQQDDELIFSLDEDQTTIESSSSPNQITTPATNTVTTTTNNTISPNYGSHSLRLRKGSPSRMKYDSVKYSKHMPLTERYGVDITPLSYVPGGKIEKYLGNLNFFFIRESTSIRENGGISGFVHSFITELLGVVRAHVLALGGNAMVSFYMTELLLVDNQHKNQGQCLISIGGDVVYVSYFTDD